VGASFLFGAILLYVPLALTLRVALIIGVLVTTAYFSLRDAVLALPWSVTALNINAKNQWQLTCKNGDFFEVFVQANTVVTPYLTVLNCQKVEATFLQRFCTIHIIILPDAVDAQAYRQLRVWLRWAKFATQ
jgi:toxin CptA